MQLKGVKEPKTKLIKKCSATASSDAEFHRSGQEMVSQGFSIRILKVIAILTVLFGKTACSYYGLALYNIYS